MEWNARPPSQWDWENLIMFNTKATENPKKFQPIDMATDVEGAINSESCYSSGGGGGGSGTGGSSSDLVMAFSSKSSASASINSSSTGELKTSKFTLEAFEDIPEDPSNKKVFFDAKPTGTSPMFSIGSGEPLLGLKLGKRTYFEDVSAGSNGKTSSLSMIPLSSVTSAKRSKANCQSTLDRYCQVEGCKLELSSAKDYHRKHRICETHSKCPKVIVDGLERRFCQQCSRFHGLSEFDEKKRSCRKRLTDHNARRRKPQKEAIRMDPVKLSLFPYGGRQQTSSMWSSIPLVQTGSNAFITWESPNDSNLLQTSEFLLKPAKEGNTYGQLHLPSRELPTSSIATLCHDSSRLFPSETIKPDFLNQGLESINIPALDETQDFHRALSLLSTNTWGSCEPKHISPHPVCTSHANMSQPMMPAMPQGLPLASSEDWQIKPPSTKSHMQTSSAQGDDGSHFQEFQLFNAPYEKDFYSSQLI